MSHVQAYIGGPAAAASKQLGAQAYTMGNKIAFQKPPSVELSAHEGTHVVQQQSGKVQLAGEMGKVGDKYEVEADAVGAKVAAGESVQHLLRNYAQRSSLQVQAKAEVSDREKLEGSQFQQATDNNSQLSDELDPLSTNNSSDQSRILSQILIPQNPVLGPSLDQAARAFQEGAAISIFWRNYNDMREANWIGGDAYFHCKANCEAAQLGPYGAQMAEWLSNSREIFDQIKGDPAEASQQDQIANNSGRISGAYNPDGSCPDMCQQFRPEGLPNRY